MIAILNFFLLLHGLFLVLLSSLHIVIALPTIAIGIVGGALTIQKAIKKRSKELITNKAKKIKSNNYARSNREKSNIGILDCTNHFALL